MMIVETAPGERISREASFTVNTSVEVAFPLFGPIREKLWAEGWDPKVIYGTSDVELHMIFQTPGSFEGEEKYTWVITQYDPGQFLVEYTVSTENRVWFIRVQCASAVSKTKVTVRYTYTSLTERGNDLNRIALEKMFSSDLNDWADAINHYLEHGTLLTTTR